MFNSDIFANRPPFGIVGRIFISTDTNQIFRDTGTSYDLIASASAGLTGSGTPGTLPLWSGSTSLGDSLITQSASVLTAAARTVVLNTNTGISALNPAVLTVNTTNTFNGGISWPSLQPCDNVEFLQNNSYNGNITFQNSNYTANHLILSSFTFLVAATTITSNQSTGIRALSNQTLQATISGTNNGTITHFANSQIYGDFAASTARFNFTNRYGYLVNNLDEYSAGHTYTNRFAFYNQGAADNNFFNGKVQIGGGTPGAFAFNLDVTGNMRLTGTIQGGTSGTFDNAFQVKSGSTGSNILTVRNDSSIFANTFNVNSIFCPFISANDTSLKITSGGTQGTTIELQNSGVFHTYTSGFVSIFLVPQNQFKFQPTSGNGIFNIFFIQPLINQTGTASGISRGILIAPVITAAVDWRAIQSETGGAYFNTTSVAASAILQADSTTKGFLLPRMTSVQKNAIVAATGLMVYDTTLNKLCVFTGLSFETITSV